MKIVSAWSHSVQAAICMAMALMACACSKTTAETKSDNPSCEDFAAPTFEADTAYCFVERQVNMGPRINGTRGHTECESWIESSLRKFGADTVICQRATITDWQNTPISINNIMGRFGIDAPQRILLLAHYDTRPYADQDSNPANRTKAVPGANDGASGVAVLMEIARLMQLQAPEIGVDLLFVDAEDAGVDDAHGLDTETTWCLGTQYWCENMPYSDTDRAKYGILLDMVAGKDAEFRPEIYSMHYARDIVDKLWHTARKSGYSSVFPYKQGGGVTDDHLFVNRAGIPCIDIIECSNPATGSFPPYWHTVADDMTNIDRNTLKAVGQTVVNLIYSEKVSN